MNIKPFVKKKCIPQSKDFAKHLFCLKLTLAALAFLMVISCWAITDNTSMSILLNSSKQHQAPDVARPEKNRPIICIKEKHDCRKY